MEKDFVSLFPVWSVEGDCIVSKSGDYTVCFEVTKQEIFTMSAVEFTALHGGFVNALRSLKPGTIVHMQDWFAASSYHANGERGGAGFLAGSSERFFHERPYLDHRCYLFVTRRADGRRPVTSATSGLLRKRLVPQAVTDQTMVREFLDSVGQFAQVLADTRLMELRRLAEDEIWSYGGKIGILEQYCQLLSPGDVPCAADISFADGIAIGENHCQLFTLADLDKLPGSCEVYRRHTAYSTEKSPFNIGFATVLGPMLDCDHIYNQYIIVQDTKSIYKRLEAKRRRLHSLSSYSRENAVARDSIDQFLVEVITDGSVLVKAHNNVLAWGNRDAAKDIRNKVSSAMAQLGVTPHIETVGAQQIWYAGIPGNAGEMPENEFFETGAEQAACFFNLETNYRSSVSPVGLRLGDRLTGRPLHIDISDEPMKRAIIGNRSKLLLGSSGAGKSFYCQTMLRAYYEQGAHIIVVDIGHSYRGLCGLVGGTYYTFSEQKPLEFNPFYLTPGEKFGSEKRESIKALLLALWKNRNETLQRSEYVTLSNALQLYFDRLDSNPAIFPCFDSFYEFLQDDFAAVLLETKVKEREFDISNFLYILRPFYRGGEYDYLLNARENLFSLQQRFIVFELDAIRSHPVLLPILGITIMEVVITKMRRLPGVRKVAAFDEMWIPLANEGMADFLKFLIKTFRKYFGEPIFATQEVEDIISSPIVKNSIINLSDCKILLDMGKLMNRFDELQNLLGLSDHEKALVLSLNKANDKRYRYKEVFISLGKSHAKVYRVEVSLEEYLTYTTEETEKVKVTAYAEKYGSMQRGIAVLAAEVRAGLITL